jgi:1,4-dihydroxy-2-naphthoyl-CoA hydrolase
MPDDVMTGQTNDHPDMAVRLNHRLPPFARLLGIQFLSAQPDSVVAQMLIREDLCTALGTIHGGAFMSFADTLGACATIVNLKEGQTTATMESKTNFFARAPMGTRIRGESLPLHKGRSTMVWQTRITSEDGKLIGVVTQTQMVLEPR